MLFTSWGHQLPTPPHWEPRLNLSFDGDKPYWNHMAKLRLTVRLKAAGFQPSLSLPKHHPWEPSLKKNQSCPATKQNFAFIKPQESVVIGSAGSRTLCEVKVFCNGTKNEGPLFFLSVLLPIQSSKAYKNWARPGYLVKYSFVFPVC